MSDLSTLISTVFTSKKEQWSFPQKFQALVEIGVTSYTVTIDTYNTKYEGPFGIWLDPAPADFKRLIISQVFNEKALIESLKSRRAGEITYNEWLNLVAQAGVASYKVTMATQTVTYFGITLHNSYTG
ncbi:DUF1398 family protein [Candidatus Dependentiae bacterium]|nr:DUF1398 family protein [Candidatus Dependentiae bacterium]